MHYKKDGTLDMRYKTSKEYVKSGGSINGPSSSHFSSNLSSNYSSNHWTNNSFKYNSPSPTSHPTFNNTSTFSSTSQSRMYTSDDIQLNYDGSIDKNSPAVKNNNILFKKDGSIDRRCKAVKQGNVILDSNDQIDSFKMDIPKKQPTWGDYYDSKTTQNTNSIDLNDNKSPYYNGIMYKKDGGIDKRCKAYKEGKIFLANDPKCNAPKINNIFVNNEWRDTSSSQTAQSNIGEILVKKDGTIDKRCAAVKRGDIKFKSDDSVDLRCRAVRSGRLNILEDGTVDINNSDVKLSYMPGFNEQIIERNISPDYNLYNNDSSTYRYSQPIRMSDLYQKENDSIYRRCDTYEIEKIDFIKKELEIPVKKSETISEPDSYDKIDIKKKVLEIPVKKSETISEPDLNDKIDFIKKELEIPVKKSETISEPIFKPQPDPFDSIDLNEKIASNEHVKSLYNSNNIDKEEEEEEEKKEIKIEETSNDTSKTQSQPYKKLPKKKLNLRIKPKKEKKKVFEHLSNKTNDSTIYNDKKDEKKDDKKDDIYNLKDFNVDNKNDKNKKLKLKLKTKSKTRSNDYTENKLTIIYIICLITLFILYFYILSKIPIKGERNYLTRCPSNAICDVTVKRNETIMSISQCTNYFSKLVNGNIQVCAPNTGTKFNEYLETLKAATYISKTKGDCLLQHQKLDISHIIDKFPKVNIELLKTNEDFLTTWTNDEFESQIPEYNTMCRIYKNSYEKPIQTTLIVLILIIGIYLISIS